MLVLDNVVVYPPNKSATFPLLNHISLRFQGPHFGAIVGPSGCGKSTLLKTISGLLEPEAGKLWWMGRDLEQDDFAPHELGYVPQFGIFHERLTVRETVSQALRLRVARRSRLRSVSAMTATILEKVGLLEIADRTNRVLSGGQQRRLGLALELVSDPAVLLCDEVTSGLDPKSEDEIVHLMRALGEEEGRIVLSVTHSLRHLHLYDSITVLSGGYLAYHGTASHLLNYFEAANAEDIFPRLAAESPEYWAERMERYRPFFEEERPDSPISVQAPAPTPAPAPPPPLPITADSSDADPDEPVEPPPAAPPPVALPGFLTQAIVLTLRRFRLFLRDPSQIGLQLALVLVFPCLVALFAYQGLPEIRNMSLAPDTNIVAALQEKLSFTVQTSKVGSLVSGLVMFQVILLTLMGANNAAREIANERRIIEKEKLSGIRPSSILVSKLVFLALLVGAQSFWMAWFVKTVCSLPGDWTTQWQLLLLVNGAMTTTSLAISAWARTAEQGSLVSIYLVGFQLPLSGAILALPDFLAPLTRPFIAAYWAWSGYLYSMQDTRFYDLVALITVTPLVQAPDCAAVLAIHILAGTTLAAFGLMKNHWDD